MGACVSWTTITLIASDLLLHKSKDVYTTWYVPATEKSILSELWYSFDIPKISVE